MPAKEPNEPAPLVLNDIGGEEEMANAVKSIIEPGTEFEERALLTASTPSADTLINALISNNVFLVFMVMDDIKSLVSKTCVTKRPTMTLPIRIRHTISFGDTYRKGLMSISSNLYGPEDSRLLSFYTYREIKKRRVDPPTCFASTDSLLTSPSEPTLCHP